LAEEIKARRAVSLWISEDSSSTSKWRLCFINYHFVQRTTLSSCDRTVHDSLRCGFIAYIYASSRTHFG